MTAGWNNTGIPSAMKNFLDSEWFQEKLHKPQPRTDGFHLNGGRVGDKLEGVEKNRARALPERPHPLKVLHQAIRE
jgi:hypothetical protein